MTAPSRESIALAEGRTLTIEVSETGGEVTLRMADGAPVALEPVTACLVGMALQRASAIAGERKAARYDRSMAAKAKARR